MNPPEILTLHQLRKTPARLAIIQSLLTSQRPLSENEIHERMQEGYDRITFYRTMLKLMESGVIHRIVADNITIRYALNQCSSQHHDHQNNHIHFYCTRCGTVECLKETIIQSYQLPEGYQKEACDVVIRGICRSCSEKAKMQ